ncbi:hypothetical protein F5Y11DRAFT_333141 [Daldinia sp. FL1419]|nr:hypothetical protein F5Y11DRAFT_333141 [Daldinia sp. FL1419]
MARFTLNPTAFVFDFKPSLEHRSNDPDLAPQEPTKTLITPSNSRAQVPCRFFQQGRCRNGDSCPYLHANSSAPNDSSQGTSTEIDTAPKSGNITRTICGALVHFEKGATVEKVALSSDFSSVQITQLPQNSTRESVLDLLRSYGINVPQETEIHVTHDRDSWSALVRVEDPEFAKTAGEKLSPQSALPSTRQLRPIATPVANPIQTDSNTLRVDCCKVHISWHKPYKPAWLNFGTEAIAKRVYNNFRDGTYKILGQRIHCNIPARGEGRFNPLAWTCLLEVPAPATESDIKESIYHKMNNPRGLQLGKPTYTVDDETCSAEIQSLFTSIGTLDWWEFTPDTAGKRMKACARFQNEGDARIAVRTLDEKPLPFNKKANLTVRLVHTAKFKVHAKIYEAVQAQLKANIRSWKVSHLTYVAYENSSPPKWYRVLKLEGEAEKEVAAAQSTITRIISGIVAKNNSSALWHPALSKNGLLFDQIREVERRNRIAIVRNKVKSQLRLYGSQAACRAAQAEIIRLLRDESSQDFYIQLEDYQLLWVLRGGLKKMEKRLGSDKISFDITSKPKHITIYGTVRDYDIAATMVTEKEEIKNEISIQDGRDCSVCWNEAEDPIRTQCGHSYCFDCFENLCFSATTQIAEALISCVGGSGSCSKVMSLLELQEHLSSNSFEELLEKSFRSYLQHHPHLFNFCPSADCGFIYRVNSLPRAQMCPNCHILVCTVCQAQHGVMSCGDYKDISTGGFEAFRRLKQAIGIKDCPKCRAPIEKSDGCNHIACRCGAHICWVCLKTFTASGDCYEHMGRVHGGIGLEQLQAMYG